MLTALALHGGAVILLGLVLLAAAALPLARLDWGGAAVHGGCAGAAGLLVLLALVGLLGGEAAPITLPIGPPFPPPWGAMHLALDGLSAWFLLLLGLSAGAASLVALGHARGSAPPARMLLPWPLLLAGMALALLAADAVSLVFGLGLAALAAWALLAHDHRQANNRAAARLYLIVAGVGAACLILGFGLLGGVAGEISFSALRAAPPEGWRAAAVLLLAVAGAGAQAGLFPLHAWLPPAQAAAPGDAAALLPGAMTMVALYALARITLDLCGPAQPVWWGAPLLALGAASAMIGALRANLEPDIRTLLGCSTVANAGLVAIGLGLCAAFRAADLGALAALAAAAALLHALHHAVFNTLLCLAAAAVARGAASWRLDRLGGLIHPMPWTAGCALVGVAAAAALPPLSGFASVWLLVQALLVAWRVGDPAFQIGAAVVAALAALAVALGAAAMVRFFGIVFLGRPRTPRAAGAEDAPPLASWALAALAGLSLLLGLFPGLMLDLADPAMRVIARASAAPRAGLSGMAAGDGAARYAPLGVALLLGAAMLALRWQVRRRAPAGVARSPAWDGGYLPPPPHLPFGDPATQPSGAGIGQPLRRMLGAPLLAARERIEMPAPGETRPARIESSHRDPAMLLAPLARVLDATARRAERLRHLSIRRCLGLGFAALVALLVVLAVLGRR